MKVECGAHERLSPSELNGERAPSGEPSGCFVALADSAHIFPQAFAFEAESQLREGVSCSVGEQSGSAPRSNLAALQRVRGRCMRSGTLRQDALILAPHRKGSGESQRVEGQKIFFDLQRRALLRSRGYWMRSWSPCRSKSRFEPVSRRRVGLLSVGRCGGEVS